MTGLQIDRIYETKDNTIIDVSLINTKMKKLVLRWPHDTPLKYIAHNTTSTITTNPPLINVTESFTRSNGTLIARIYERLTKASRRRADGTYNTYDESMYRQGVLDAFNALRDELRT